jgi:hypothetical protein
MPDVWATVTNLDSATQQRLADVLETRGADPQQQALRTSFLASIGLTDEALEVRLYPLPAAGGQGSSAAARLGGGPPRAATARGDAAAVAGGASRRPPRRLRL